MTSIVINKTALSKKYLKNSDYFYINSLGTRKICIQNTLPKQCSMWMQSVYYMYCRKNASARAQCRVYNNHPNIRKFDADKQMFRALMLCRKN